MATAPKGPLSLVPAEPAVEFKPPRGPIVNAKWVVRHYYTDPDTKRAIISEKWVRENIPGKVRVGHSTVGWFRDDVVEYHEQLRKQAASS